MIIYVEKFNRSEWRAYSEQAHLICFGTHKPSEWDRIDFTLIARNEERLLGYVTCREHDAETLYWQFGGAFPDTKGTVLSWRAYQALTQWCEGKYKRITTLIENDNDAMLKLAAKIGYKIIGVRNYQGAVLLEHVLELP